jgi:hypothetical protein
MNTNHDMTPQADPEHDGRGPNGGLAVSLWLLAIVLAQYLVTCWVMIHTYAA